ncbi:PAS domain S-box protein [Rhizobium grahamii]|nr:PAS domain S-box protein [Rhizobium grahamii]
MYIVSMGDFMVTEACSVLDVQEQRAAWKGFDESEAHYRRIFDGAHVALWDQDFSRLVARLEELRADGVDDIRGYFQMHPEATADAVKLVHVRDVNVYAMELFEAHDKVELTGDLGATFLPETSEVFLDEIVALWEGRKRFESEAQVRTLKGQHLEILLTIAWEGKNCEHSLVSILDISRQKAVQRRFQTLNNVAHIVSSDLELERVVQAVTDNATSLSGAEFGAFFYNLNDAKGERLTLYTLSGAPREAFERFGVPRNTSVFEPTFRGEGIVRSDDIRKDARYGHNEPHHGMPKGHLPVVSYLAVPVVSRSSEVLGGLFFGHSRPGVFTKETEEIVAGIAAHAAMAIDNARLLRTVQNELEHRQQAELAARRLASIVESSQDAIISKGLDGVITSWNQGAERLFGYTAAEIVGRPVTTLFPDELLAEEADIIDRIRSGQRIEHYETVRIHKDGTPIDISLTISPLKDAEGRIIGASKIARDISDRKRAEEALAQRTAEQAVLHRMTDRLYHGSELQLAFDAALDAITSALGCARASILLFDDQKVMRFVAWRGLSQTYRHAVDGHSPWTAETTDATPMYVSTLDEADLTAELRATIEAEKIGALAFIPLFGEGRVTGKFMAYYDQPHTFSTEEETVAVAIARQLGFAIQRVRSEQSRLRAEAGLRESEQRLQLALEAGGMGAWEWDLTSGKIIWSPGLELIHGRQPGSFDGSFSDFKRDIHPDDIAEVESAIQTAAAKREPYHAIYRALLPDGEQRWLEAFGRCFEESNGALKKLSGICMDITARKQAEEQREILVAELSHRVKNTLATVTAIARQSFSSSAREDCRSFEARIRALAQTHGRLAETEWSGVSLRTILDDELSPFRREDGQNIRMAGPLVSLPPKPALALGLAFHELATNAAKYGSFSDANGYVSVDWELHDDGLRIQWTEHGGPLVDPPTRSGFGRLLLEKILAADLNGKVDIDYDKQGVRCSLSLPVRDRRQSRRRAVG